MSSPTHEALDSLTELCDLITVAVQVIKSEYSTVGKPVPSLDETSAGPFDTLESSSPTLTKAIRVLEAACAQLTYTVAPPAHVLTNKTYAYDEIACLLTVCNAKIADILLDHPSGLPVSEIGAKCGIDGSKLGRVMRLLATKHVFREVENDIFANNRLSIKLISSDPVSALVSHGVDNVNRATSRLSEVLLNTDITTSNRPEDCAFVLEFGSKPFDFYSDPANQFHAERFGRSMMGWGSLTGSRMLSKVYPWDNTPKDTKVCDVGCAQGHIALALIQTWPHLQVVLQDLPALIDQAKSMWSTQHPTAIQEGRVTFVPMDFFKEAPVQGCDYYFIRYILHDWPDAECITILGNIRKAMIPGSRLLIQEIALRPAVRQEQGSVNYEQAPPPLLPNYGVAQARLYNQDINMMASFNSKERTMNELVSLCAQVGLSFVKMWDALELDILEFEVA